MIISSTLEIQLQSSPASSRPVTLNTHLSCMWSPAGVCRGLGRCGGRPVCCPSAARGPAGQQASGWKQACSRWLRRCMCTYKGGWAGRFPRSHSGAHSGRSQPPSCLLERGNASGLLMWFCLWAQGQFIFLMINTLLWKYGMRFSTLNVLQHTHKDQTEFHYLWGYKVSLQSFQCLF